MGVSRHVQLCWLVSWEKLHTPTFSVVPEEVSIMFSANQLQFVINYLDFVDKGPFSLGMNDYDLPGSSTRELTLVRVYV